MRSPDAGADGAAASCASTGPAVAASRNRATIVRKRFKLLTGPCPWRPSQGGGHKSLRLYNCRGFGRIEAAFRILPPAGAARAWALGPAGPAKAPGETSRRLSFGAVFD